MSEIIHEYVLWGEHWNQTMRYVPEDTGIGMLPSHYLDKRDYEILGKPLRIKVTVEVRDASQIAGTT